SNFILVIIIVGALFSLLNRSKTGTQGRTPNKGSMSMPSFGGNGNPFATPKAAEVQTVKKESVQRDETILQTYSAPKVEMDKPYSGGMVREQDNRIVRLKPTPQPEANRHELRRNAGGKAHSVQQQALKGMMWAEVFGPPRAKKSHRVMK
ncbi:MAG: hypothetical protein A2189_06860, partial [Paenibacillus sp. RIFOXYA1_FULL_44_5]